MEAGREIVATPPDGQDIRPEFYRFLDEARENHWYQLEVLFGFAWDSEWAHAVLSPDKLQSRVKRLEDEKIGAIGEDDVFITLGAPSRKYRFCHHNDIHLEGSPDDPYLDAAAEHYRALGWTVADRQKA